MYPIEFFTGGSLGRTPRPGCEGPRRPAREVEIAARRIRSARTLELSLTQPALEGARK